MLPPFAIERPADAATAATLLGEDSVAYWGGTELLLAMKMGLLRPEVLVDLKGIAELRTIRAEDGKLVIGAGCTHDEIARAEGVVRLAPLLARVEHHVGNARVRCQGSIGGNLCFAEPRSDLAATLIAVGATVQLSSPRGSRDVAAADFIQGAYWTAREPDELLTTVSVPTPCPVGVYLKMQTSERPTVGVAAVADGDGFTLVVGAVTETPVALRYASLAEIDAEAIAEELEPVPDITGSVRYKRHVTATYVRRAVAALRAEVES